MERTNRLLDYYLPPGEGFILESMLATTYQVDFEFFEEELLAAALGVRSPISRLRAFRSELERKLQEADVSVLYDPGGCDRLARLSPRVDAIPIYSRKLHSKISLLTWTRENRATGEPPDRRMRLIVGSANLTRQGFRHNYECVSAMDFGGRISSSREMLISAIKLTARIGAESSSPQLRKQLALLNAQAARLPEGTSSPDDPISIVDASDVLPSIRSAWTAISSAEPESVTLVSPFWPQGNNAAEALFELVQQIGRPASLEIVCCGERSPNGRAWLPVFDGAVAIELKKRFASRLFLRAALPSSGVADSEQLLVDVGDETEEREFASCLGAANNNPSDIQRSLHAKIILVDGKAGGIVYAGSSNCTRRGLGLGGPTNFEAGAVYRLTPRQRKQLAGLISFAGPATEVRPDCDLLTMQPIVVVDPVIPRFLAEVVAAGSVISIRFREAVPSDLVLLMPIPTKAGDAGYWVLFRSDSSDDPAIERFTIDLAKADKCDDRLASIPAGETEHSIQPHVFIEARWQGLSATFPVRFDDKTQLPLLLVGRKPTEGELIEYFLFGVEPDVWEDNASLQNTAGQAPSTDAPIDTRKILAYFIRRFVQAIPGIEAEIRRAGYSHTSLDCALRGPTSPLELAERAFISLSRSPSNDEPEKTPIAVGFHLTEILAALLRCKSHFSEPDFRQCFEPVIVRVRDLLAVLVSNQPELEAEGFRLYQSRILGDGQ